MNEALIGLGSNIDPEQNIPAGVRLLSTLVRIVAVSSLWETAAIGSNGPAFLNGALKIKSEYSQDQIKSSILRSIEEKLGRVRSEDKNAPRTMDLDIVVFNGEVLDPKIFLLDHLILPLAEIEPDLFDIITGKKLEQIAREHCCKPTAVKIGPLVY